MIRLPLLLLFVPLTISAQLSQAGPNHKIDPIPFFSHTHDVYKSPEAAADAMKHRKGIWSDVFQYVDSGEKLAPIESENIEVDVVWKSEDLAVVFANAEVFRTEFCAVWMSLKLVDRQNAQWQNVDTLVRRDAGYSYADMEWFETITGVPRPVLLIETFRGGRRHGNREYEAYLLEEEGQFRCVLNVHTRYTQYSWSAGASFEKSKEGNLVARLSREHMKKGESEMTAVEIHWNDTEGRFDAEPIENYIAPAALNQKNQAAEN